MNMVFKAKCQQKMLLIYHHHHVPVGLGVFPVPASYILLNEILTTLNNKQMVGGIFYYLHKAFDCVNHAVLLEKMKFYIVSGKFYNLVKSYFDGR